LRLAHSSHLLAVASPTADLLQFAREALWLAQERDLSLTLAVRRVGRVWARVTGSDQADDLAAFAARWNITLVPWRSAADVDAIIDGWTARPPKAVMLGARRQWFMRAGLPAATAGRLRRSARARGIEVITDPANDFANAVLGLAWRIDETRPWYHAYILSALAVSLVAIVVKWLDGIIDSESLAILFVTAVVYSANAYGMGAALFTSILSVGMFDYFFQTPRYEIHPASPQDILLLIPLLTIAAITSNLSSGLRRQVVRSQRQAREARALFQLTRDIAVATDTAAIFHAIIQQCNDIFDCSTALLTPTSGAGSDVLTLASARARAATLQAAYPPNTILSQEEIEAARWVYAYAAPAGRGTRVKPDLDMLLQPLESSEGTVAVLALRNIPKETLASPGFRRLIGSICRLAALAVEHTLRKNEVENARVVSQTEGLRSALLSSISHDFGTPLASIIGSASSLISYGKTYSFDVVEELLVTILEEAERLNRFVKNVLQMTRLESGALVPRLQWADVGDLIATALDAAHRRLTRHEIYADVPDMLPLVNVDFVLMESVLVNLLDNAAKYSPPDSDIRVVARRLGDEVALEITDQGRGIAAEELGAVFDKFYRARQRDRIVPGTGLGLAICKGIIEAHGGTIEALSEGPGRGTTIRICLPVKAPDTATIAEV
jgi:two-component system sensor histidine kinase KdpD